MAAVCRPLEVGEPEIYDYFNWPGMNSTCLSAFLYIVYFDAGLHLEFDLQSGMYESWSTSARSLDCCRQIDAFWLPPSKKFPRHRVSSKWENFYPRL